MAEKNAAMGEAEGAGGFDKFLTAQGSGGGADDAAHGEPAESGDGENERDEVGKTQNGIDHARERFGAGIEIFLVKVEE